MCELVRLSLGGLRGIPFTKRKFDDFEVQITVMVLEELYHWEPINYDKLVEEKFDNSKESVNFTSNSGGHSLRLSDDGAKPRNRS